MTSHLQKRFYVMILNNMRSSFIYLTTSNKFSTAFIRIPLKIFIKGYLKYIPFRISQEIVLCVI